MAARLMDGAAVARQLLEETARDAERFSRAAGRRPTLATVLVGDDPASATYVRMKQRRCATTGLDSRAAVLAVASTTADVVAAVRELDADDTVDGILVQHPAPHQVDERQVFEAISATKDVDGVTVGSAQGLVDTWPVRTWSSLEGVSSMPEPCPKGFGDDVVTVARPTPTTRPRGVPVLGR